MADTHNEAEVMRRYPVVSGLAANQKHEGRQENLVPTNGSVVRRRLKVGMRL